MADQGMRRLEELYVNKIKKRVREIGERYVWTDRRVVEDVAVSETMDHLTLHQARRRDYVAAADGLRWGKPWSTAWFRLRIRVPREWRGKTVSLHFRSGGECLIYRDDRPVQALDNGRSEYTLLDRASGGERIALYVEAGASNAFGRFQPREMHSPEIAILNHAVWDAYHDLLCLSEMIDVLPEKSTRRAQLIAELTRAVDLFSYDAPSPDELGRQARAVRRALAPMYARRANASAQTLACLGHAHIDVAWLWPLAETVRKCGRTFSNVLELMRRYPDFKFVQSQPHLYEFTRDRYPDLYRRIKAKVKSGQWIPTGCMWVEADCNVTSGESLVRQVLFGTRFFKQEFGHDVVCLWLPDVFGYSAALPQILKRSGIDYFLTQKISWSQFTRFPYHSFWWEGIDGTPVLTHFPPCDTYNSDLNAGQMRHAAENHREKGLCPVQAVPYGYGDGGGGPNKLMLERMKRYADLEGVPKLQPMAPEEFFQRLDDSAFRLPHWVGELYLELHRGTYTTQAANKRSNRKAELMLRETEMLSALNLVAGGEYEQEALNSAWKTVLLNQFHDIIPGSSISEVYVDSARQYKEVFETMGGIRDRAFSTQATRFDTTGDGQAVLVFNSLSGQRCDATAVRIKGLRRNRDYVADVGGRITAAQVCSDGLTRFEAELPPVGHAVAHIRAGQTDMPCIAAGSGGLENAYLKVRFDKRGRVISVYDKDNGREAIDRGEVANRFLLYEDKPNNWDAWDIDFHYNDKLLEADGELLSAEVVEQGPVRSLVRFKRRLSKSLIVQDVILYASSRCLEFDTTVEWGDEKDVLLKVAFPVDVRSATARYEIQFGNVERPTHMNRPDDFGRFEVPAQRWADLSEGDYGVALLNDCKYGYDTRGNVMRLTLLRAPKSPDPTADVNKTHRFKYALFPHSDSYLNGVVKRAAELNCLPLAAAVASSAGEPVPNKGALAVTSDNVVIDTVKKAEDDDGIIVRMYEAHGCRGRRTLSTTLPVERIEETDLMERAERELKHRDGKVALLFKPFQIRTLKLTVAAGRSAGRSTRSR
jgi:alpha-mannosidase